jgi:5-methylcytosine-specific restriction protein B
VEGGLGKDYESSTVAYKFYEKGKVPDDEDIADDLAAVLEIYEKYIGERGRILERPNGPEEKNHPAPDRAEVERLLQFLEDQGLHFPEELVGNYLLAYAIGAPNNAKMPSPVDCAT